MREVATMGMSGLLSDERLTRRAVGGDEHAFAAIFRRYHQALYRFCLAIVGNPEDAQDALQNTMIKVLRALPGEERRIELKPWLYRIAHNESIDLLRRRRETAQLDVQQVAPGHGLSEDAEARERLRGLLVDLRELPDRQREVLVMREMSGLGFDEIGAALETSAAVARQTLYEARQSLRQMAEGRELDCDGVSRALSDGDGRVTRRRDVRAHLRVCLGCREFRDEIKGREHDLAALAPLPAVVAAGMLQGLIGGSQAAGGGGLAAALGGGAAKTIATSATVKGVATVAVVAAVGVTAADRSGTIHLGLPGEESAQAGPAATGAPGTQHEKGRPSDAGDAESAGAEKPGSAPHQGKAALGTDPSGHQQPTSGDLEGHPAAPADTQLRGAPAEIAGAHGQEKQQPQAAPGGQETAAEHQPPPSEPGSGDAGNGSEAAPGEPPSSSAPGNSGSAPKGPPEEPAQGEAPEGPPQGQKPQTPAEGLPPPGQVDNPGKGAEKGKGQEKGKGVGLG